MSYKAQELAAELADELKKRCSSTMPIVTQSVDANGDPTITVSADATPAAGEKVVFIRVKAIAWPLSLNSIGLASEVFTPHVIEFATEKNFEGTTDNVLDILGPTELLPLLGAIINRGTRVDWYRSTNGTVPSVTTLNDSTKLSASIEGSLYGGMRSSQ